MRRWLRNTLAVTAAIPTLTFTGELIAPPRWQAIPLPHQTGYPTLPPIPSDETAPLGVDLPITGHEVSVAVDNDVLEATVVSPNQPGRHPAVALLQGAGRGSRNDYVEHAEALARSGIVALVYDKRAQGYSFRTRDYGVLADDAIRMVRFLQTRDDVDPDRVGLWGLSEGGSWVIPLAASRSDDIAFSVLVSSTFITPLEQVSWALNDHLHHSHASSGLRTLAGRLLTFGAFPYTGHQSIPVLETVHTPVLALYGTDDRAIPLVESARHLSASLEKAGNQSYTIRYFDGADHLMRVAGGALAPGSMEVTARWIHRLPDVPSARIAGAVPDQTLTAEGPPSAPEYATGTTLLVVLALQVVGYLSGPVAARLTGGTGRVARLDADAMAAWTPIKTVLRPLAAAGISSAFLITALMGGEVAMAITEAYSAPPLHVGWALTRLAALATVALGVITVDRVLSFRRGGWMPDLAQGAAILGVLGAAALQTLNTTYLGLFDPTW